MKNEKGLTLIELLAVIVILAIISAIAVPAIGNIIENTRYNAAKADAVNVLNAANLYFTDEPDETSVTLEKLKSEKYLDHAGKLEKPLLFQSLKQVLTKYQLQMFHLVVQKRFHLMRQH